MKLKEKADQLKDARNELLNLKQREKQMKKQIVEKIEKDPLSILNIPENETTYEMWLAAVGSSSRDDCMSIFKRVPNKFMSSNILFQLASKNYWDFVDLDIIPEQVKKSMISDGRLSDISPVVVINSFNSRSSSSYNEINRFVESLKHEDVDHNYFLEKIPMSDRTYSMYEAMTLYDDCSLEFIRNIPSAFASVGLYGNMVKKNPAKFPYIPQEYKTAGLCKLYYVEMKLQGFSPDIGFIPKDLQQEVINEGNKEIETINNIFNKRSSR